MSDPEKPGSQDGPARVLMWMVAGAFVSLGVGALMTGDFTKAVFFAQAAAVFFVLGLLSPRLVPLLGPRFTESVVRVASDVRWWLVVLLALYFWGLYPFAMVRFGFRTADEMWPEFARKYLILAQPFQPPPAIGKPIDAPTPAPPSMAPAPPPNVSNSTGTPDVASASPKSTEAEDQEKIILNVDVPFLINIYQGRTSIEADKIFSIYQHKWIRVTGKLQNMVEITPGRKDFVVYLLMSGPRKISLNDLKFDRRWTDKLQAEPFGSSISALCRLVGASALGISLDRCELVDRH